MKNAIKIVKYISILATCILSSCTYAPKTTLIDNTYTARQMAIGVGENQRDGMTSTIHEDDSVSESTPEHEASTANSKNRTKKINVNQQISQSQPQRKFITIGSTKSDVIRIQGTPTSLHRYSFGEEWWFYGFSHIVFKNSRVDSWADSDGRLRVGM